MVDLTLTASCHSCGSAVAVEVPRWIISAMETTSERGEELRRRERSTSGEVMMGEEGGGTMRDGIVGGAIGAARFVKASPIPGLIVAIFQAFLAFILYVDARFSLHQRLALFMASFFEGLVRIEKEVGVMKNAGDWLSIGWEATIRGIIAFAKTDAPQRSTRRSAPTHFHRRPSDSYHQASAAPHDVPFDHFEVRTSRSGTASPHYPVTYPTGFPFPSSSAGHLDVPTNDGSTSGYDLRSGTLSPSSTSRALRRSAMSSPSLQSAYLASAHVHPSTFQTDSPGFSLSSSPSDQSSLPPYYDTSSGTSRANAHAAPLAYVENHPQMSRQRSVSGPETSPHPTKAEGGGGGGSWAGRWLSSAK